MQIIGLNSALTLQSYLDMKADDKISVTIEDGNNSDVLRSSTLIADGTRDTWFGTRFVSYLTRRSAARHNYMQARINFFGLLEKEFGASISDALKNKFNLTHNSGSPLTGYRARKLVLEAKSIVELNTIFGLLENNVEYPLTKGERSMLIEEFQRSKILSGRLLPGEQAVLAKGLVTLFSAVDKTNLKNLLRHILGRAKQILDLQEQLALNPSEIYSTLRSTELRCDRIKALRAKLRSETLRTDLLNHLLHPVLVNIIKDYDKLLLPRLERYVRNLAIILIYLESNPPSSLAQDIRRDPHALSYALIWMEAKIFPNSELFVKTAIKRGLKLKAVADDILRPNKTTTIINPTKNK